MLEDLQLSTQELNELLKTKQTHPKEPEKTKEEEDQTTELKEEPILSKEEIFSLAQEIGSE